MSGYKVPHVRSGSPCPVYSNRRGAVRAFPALRWLRSPTVRPSRWARSPARARLRLGRETFGDLKTVANLTNFTVFAVFILINAVVIRLRFRKPVKTGFHSPISIGKLPLFPVLGIVTSCFMLVFIELPILLMGAGLTLLGIVLQYIYYAMIEQT